MDGCGQERDSSFLRPKLLSSGSAIVLGPRVLNSSRQESFWIRKDAQKLLASARACMRSVISHFSAFRSSSLACVQY